jgi:hypothetical protein
VALRAHGVWTHWAAAALGAQLRAELGADAALTSHTPLRNWAETVVKNVRALCLLPACL